jgi:hypothetical protein
MRRRTPHMAKLPCKSDISDLPSTKFSPRISLPAKWIRLGFLVLFFATVLTSLPVHLKHNGANAQSSRPRRTQGAPGPNLPNLDEVRGIQPGTPRIMPSVPATKCRGRDEKCKRVKGK